MVLPLEKSIFYDFYLAFIYLSEIYGSLSENDYSFYLSILYTYFDCELFFDVFAEKEENDSEDSSPERSFDFLKNYDFGTLVTEFIFIRLYDSGLFDQIDIFKNIILTESLLFLN